MLLHFQVVTTFIVTLANIVLETIENGTNHIYDEIIAEFKNKTPNCKDIDVKRLIGQILCSLYGIDNPTYCHMINSVSKFVETNKSLLMDEKSGNTVLIPEHIWFGQGLKEKRHIHIPCPFNI